MSLASDIWKRKAISESRCIDCGRKHQTGYQRCQEHLDKQKQYAQERRDGKR